VECVTSHWDFDLAAATSLRSTCCLFDSGVSEFKLCTILSIHLNLQVYKFSKLPSSLLRFLLCNRVFKIGSAVKADLTCLKKQFPELQIQSKFTVIDLKEHCINRNIIPRNTSGSLETLVECCLGMYISKEERLRKCDDWEKPHLHPDLIQYAALDAYTIYLTFEKTLKIAPITRICIETPPGTLVALLAQVGGQPIAYGWIVDL